jgi:hypothetical protein
LQIIGICCCEIAEEIKIYNINDLNDKEILHLNSFSGESTSIKDRRISKKLLKELEVWWLLYNLRRCCSEDPINVEEIEKIMHDDLLDDYVLGEDIIEIIYEAVKKLPDHEDLPIWGYLNYSHNIFDHDHDSSKGAVFYF